ncbi:MAG: 2-oxo acid dehydrogenase subunit E2 [Kiritimatiellae bacterium]|nr:2-oxo acid dehydrogenase subunit E2 [Kiritimatiellia bacterium]
MNIDLGEKQVLTSYRKIAIASWRHPRDPNTYAMLDLPVEAAMEFIRTYPSETPLTLTHFVTKIVAHCLDKYSELNHVLRMGNLYKRKQIDIFITTLLRGSKGKDLSGFVIRNANLKTITEVADISKSRAEDLRHNRDKENIKVQQIVNPLPSFLLRPLLLIQEFLQFTLNIAIPSLGMPKDRFGSAMITNIGALGIENAFIPLSPYARCPLIIGIGKPRKIPVVQDDKIIVGNSVIITLTFDHRYADGAHGSHLMRRFKKIFLNPSAHKNVFATEE